ncbi:adenosylcobinamide amidohydrolase [Paractinoplanes brasiliensis]|uniref:Adenosylcobinamide amidohydrolase n=1 Tax=Paractinoplanes brasiliensis TaxID=52695 RepID=A0A4R6K0L5_9ACTN|nr:adenosylcobinamide amidohydrolase [Actinoplanes brasiliensis]TDO41116.1 adenosylcobinamide amidohydrolase [Actinoplanes brasiliensis]GID26186.1 hypothetical protein Abr02nite_11690 [Actinoplanes brasiliensis]
MLPDPELTARREHGHDVPLLLWRLPTPVRAISSAVLGGGIGPCEWLINVSVPMSYNHDDPADHLTAMAAGLGLHGPGVGLLTGVDVADVVTASDGGVRLWATVGLGAPIQAAAGHPTSDAPPAHSRLVSGAPSAHSRLVSDAPSAAVPAYSRPAARVDADITDLSDTYDVAGGSELSASPHVPSPAAASHDPDISDLSGASRGVGDGYGGRAVRGAPSAKSVKNVSGAEDAGDSYTVGTVNIVVWVPERLSDGALVNAVATLTEAKTQAIRDLGLEATGTATDAVCVLCPMDGAEAAYGGPRSTWGARLARAAYAAVLDGGKSTQPWSDKVSGK